MKRALCSIVIAAAPLALVLSALPQAVPPPPPKPPIARTPPPPPPPPPPAYQQALDMINRGRYQAALAQLQALQASRNYGDARLYWQAFAQARLNRLTAAMASLARLHRNYAKSPWEPDAAALQLELDQAGHLWPPGTKALRTPPAFAALAAPRVNGGDELKLLAINGLMQNDPQQALPLLEKVLSGPDSLTVKRRALFVLAQSRDPGAVAAIAGLAGNAGAPALQREAIRDLAITGHADDLWAIYQRHPPLAVKREIIQALAMSGDVGRLVELARTEANPSLQTEAVRALGMSASPAAMGAVASMYAGAANPTLSQAVIEAMFLHNDAAGLVALARKESDPRLKQAIVARLSLMRNPAAAAYLMEILSH